MSTRQTGNRHENSFMDLAGAMGYCSFAARGSRGPIDVLCFAPEGAEAPLRPLAVQVGTTNKAISATLDALEDAPRPIGSRIMVARRHKQKNGRIRWTYHTVFGTYDDLADAVKA